MSTKKNLPDHQIKASSFINETENDSAPDSSILKWLDGVNRALNNSADVDQIIGDVISEVFTIFGCDRIWLFHPCDPDAETFRVLAEKANPDYPGAFSSGQDLPITSEAAVTIKKALDAGEPVVFDPESGNVIDDVAAKFSVKSQMIMAVHPKIGKPWMLGMHQCTYHRIWTPNEQRLFKEISYRVVESLNNLILLRDLKHSNERFKVVMDSLDALVYVADLESYEILFINKYGRDIWGDVVGKKCWQTIQAGQVKPCDFCTNDRLFDERKRPCVPYVWKCKNTITDRWYECRDQAILWPSGKYVRMEVAVDITERRRAKEAQKKHEDQIRQAHMAGMAEMAAEVLHNIGNAITPAHIASSTIVKMLKESSLEKDLGRCLQEFQEVFESSSFVAPEDKERLTRIVEQLPALVGKEIGGYLEGIQKISTKHEHIENIITLQNNYARLPGYSEELDFNKIIDDALEMMSESLKTYSVRIEKDYGHLEKFSGEKSKLIQVLINLIKNGQEATYEKPPGERQIIITTCMTNQSPLGVVCTIKDNGCGFTAEQAARMFDFGYTTKQNGFGLGLHSCANYIKFCGGSITAHSEGAGNGAEFTFRLPMKNQS